MKLLFLNVNLLFLCFEIIIVLTVKQNQLKGRVRTLQDNPYSCIFGAYLQDGCLGYTETHPLHQHPLQNSAQAGAAHLKKKHQVREQVSRL